MLLPCLTTEVLPQISLSERRGIRHHLIDVLDPTEDFSAGDFYRLARAATEDILQVTLRRPSKSFFLLGYQ